MVRGERQVGPDLVFIDKKDSMKNREVSRRSFVVGAASVAVAGLLRSPMASAVRRRADLQIRIEPATLEIAPGVMIKTIAYNGQVPGPVLRLKQGKPVTIDVTNASPKPDIVHWHGLTTDPCNDGATEEGSPMIPAGSVQPYHLTPELTGTRWYHTHAMAMNDLSRGTYSGQFGFLLVESGREPGSYDREVNLAIHHWDPYFVPMISTLRKDSQNAPQTTGSDVGYRHATVNAHKLGTGEPIRVKQGERILFRLLNASATENVMLALPRHRFTVVAMDGNPVPTPKPVEVLSLAVAERVDAIVEMNAPGVWVLGSTLKESRDIGLGVAVEYAGSNGDPVWLDPTPSQWDYAQFGSTAIHQPPDFTIPLTFRDAGALNGSKFDTWTINGDAYADSKPIELRQGKRYRLLFRNATGDQHPVHLHRHSFELTSLGDTPTAGVMKDVVNLMPLQIVAVDFTANNPGDTLFHCHQQLHMDYGFMRLFRYVG
jgi:FtsP/CotA-like multicopper oxidase with cupredoxin domain